MGVNVNNGKSGIVGVTVMAQQLLIAPAAPNASGIGDISKKPFFMRDLLKGGFRMCCLVLMLLSAGAAHAVEPAEAWEGNWGVRMVIPSAAWPDLVTSWDPTAFSDQFTQLTSSSHVMVNVTHPANSTYYTSPNPPLVAAIPEMADRFPTRDVLGETLDEIDAAGKKAIVYFACEGFKADPTLGTLWMDYITSQGYTYNADGVREYLVKYYAETYGDKIDGWWFDGANEFILRGGEGQVQLVKDAVHSGNPDAICAFGSDEGSDYFGGHPTLRTKADHWSYDFNYQTVTRIEAGPWMDTDKLPVADPADGALGHIFSAMQANWTSGTLAFPAWQAANWCRRAVDAGGMFTWAIPLDVTEMLDPQFQLARLINTVIGGDEFIIESFETGFGDWIDGGADCSHYTGPYASHAAGAIKLTGNTSSSLMSTGNLPMNGSSTAAVDFGFYATGFGTGGRFELQISTNGGSNYTTVKAWTYSTDFANNEHNNDIKHLEGYSFNDQTRFRFRCYASGGSVYIDDIRVNAITTNPPSPLPVDPKPVFICDPIIKYYRNYAKEGVAYESYAGSPIITGSAIDGNGDTLTYSKVAGPAWLLVASNGYLSGTPLDGDAGINEFTVQADDGTGNTTNAQLIITVKPAPELLIHHEFDESTGSTASDSSGNEYDGTLQNMSDADWVAGKFGNALDFDGINDWVVSSYTGSFSQDTDYTWAAWIKTTGNGTIMAKAPQTGNWVQGGKTLFVTDGKVRFDVGWVGYFEADTIVNDGLWHHVALTVESTGVNDIVRIYIDGENKATQYKWDVNEYDDSGLVLKVGDTSDSFGPHFAGLIDEARVYDGAMTESEIADLLYPNPLAPFTFVVYHDTFDNDGLATNAGTGGGLEAVTSLGVNWVDDGDLFRGSGGAGDRAVVSSLNAFDLSNGFTLTVKWTGTDSQYGDSFGLSTERWTTDAASLTLGAQDPFGYGGIGGHTDDDAVAADYAYYGIGLAYATTSDISDPYDKGLIFNDASGIAGETGGQRQQLSNPAIPTSGDNTLVLTVVGDLYSYSINGAPATNGEIVAGPGAFDLSQPFYFNAYSQNGATTITEVMVESELTNNAPSFTPDPINEIDATEDAAYSSTIADDASDPEDDPMTFSKVSGPSWLSVASNGDLSGTPGDFNVGANVFTVQVSATGGTDTAILNIEVLNTYSGAGGMEDFAGLAAQWLSVDCGTCGGADLDGDADVTLSDLAILADNWLNITLPPELVGYWQFDETDGTAAPDASIYGRDGILMNMDDTDWVAGNTGNGNALDFDGIDDYVQIAGDAVLNPNTSNWSTSFWCKSSTPSQGTMIVSKRATAAPYAQYSIGLSSGNSYSWAAGSKLTFLFREDTGIEKGGYTTSDVDISDWTHVCVVLDRTAGTVYVYIDGVSVPVTLDHDDTMPTINNSEPLHIGGIPGVLNHYQGQIDEVRIYDRALIQPEIQSVMN